MPPGKTQDVLCLFCSFLLFFKTRSKSTFLCQIWSKMCPQKKNKKYLDFCLFYLFCSFLFFLPDLVYKMSSNREQKDHAAGKIAKCPLSFCCWIPPPPPPPHNIDLPVVFAGPISLRKLTAKDFNLCNGVPGITSSGNTKILICHVDHIPYCSFTV